MSSKPKAGVTTKNPDRQERHSATGKSDQPAKAGHGGWGTLGSEAKGAPLDPRDPNYQSDEEGQ